jgi:hypothetical protein
MNVRDGTTSLRSVGLTTEKRPVVAVVSTSAQKPNAIIRHVSATCTLEQRQTMISAAAYFMAEHRGFESGHELQDWLFAESQIDAAIACGELPHVYKL